MRILVTGAASLLGRAVPSALPTTTALRAVDVAFSSSDRSVFASAELMPGDLRELDFLTRALDGVDAVLHLAPFTTGLENDTATLDHATRGTYQLALAAADAGVSRIILGSTQNLFGDLWRRYRIDEGWRPRPQPHLDQLCAYLAEVALREVTRTTGVPASCLRFGAIVDDSLVHEARAAGLPSDPRWLHVDDAVTAILRALETEAQGWQLFHIGAAGEYTAMPNARARDDPFSYAPARCFVGPDDPFPTPVHPLPEPVAKRPVRRVVVFGAGGPLGAAVAEELQDAYELVLADIRSAEECATAKPQSDGAPLPSPPQPPHEWRIVDVRDATQVMAACEGMDAIVNCSVLRSDPADAFLVNTLGAYHVMAAAVAHGIRRVVHTGPYLIAQEGPAGFRWDDWIADDVPARPGTDWVYLPTKLLGKEICRIYAEYYGLEVPALAFVQFRNPDIAARSPGAPQGTRLFPFSVSWADAARAVRAALEVAELPSPFEYIHIGAELPHGVYPMAKAKRILGWEATDFFEECYTRR